MTMKSIRWAEIGLFVAGIILWGISIESGKVWMTTLGVSSVGGACMVGGLMAMSTGELTLFRGQYGVTRDHGLTARLFGLALSLIGGGLLAIAAARILGWDDQLAYFFGQRPGFAMLPIGVLFQAIGAANIVGAWNRRGSFIGVFQSLKNWFAGLLFMVLGLGLIGVGLFEVAAPQAFDELLNSFLAPSSGPDLGL